ncbi:MAG: hypothetical protein IK093_19705 [Ruminiclostridium sp.]|nr:hypothetical protein [Ruminiclostridium sp.]
MQECEFKNIEHLVNITDKIVKRILDTKCSNASEIKNGQGCEYDWCETVSKMTNRYLNQMSLRRYINFSEHISDFWCLGGVGASPCHIASFSGEEYERNFRLLADFSKQYNLIFAEKYCDEVDVKDINSLEDEENILFNIFSRALTMGDKMDSIFAAMANNQDNIDKALEFGEHDPELESMEKPEIIRAVFFETMNAFILDVPFVEMGDTPPLNRTAAIQNALIVRAVVEKALTDYEVSGSEDFSPFGRSAIKACEGIIDDDSMTEVNRRVEEAQTSQQDKTNEISM